MNKQDEILRISKKHKLSHIGSCLSILPILEDIYRTKGERDIVLLDCAHAHLAHALFLNKMTAEESYLRYGIHCDVRAGCDMSGGSLGHAVGFGIGFAVVDPTRDVHVIISDGSATEGTLAEALRIAHDMDLQNLKIYANFNSYTAVSTVDLDYFESFIGGFRFPVTFYRTNNGLPELDGVKGHYLTTDQL